MFARLFEGDSLIVRLRQGIRLANLHAYCLWPPLSDDGRSPADSGGCVDW